MRETVIHTHTQRHVCEFLIEPRPAYPIFIMIIIFVALVHLFSRRFINLNNSISEHKFRSEWPLFIRNKHNNSRAVDERLVWTLEWACVCDVRSTSPFFLIPIDGLMQFELVFIRRLHADRRRREQSALFFRCCCSKGGLMKNDNDERKKNRSKIYSLIRNMIDSSAISRMHCWCCCLVDIP